MLLRLSLFVALVVIITHSVLMWLQSHVDYNDNDLRSAGAVNLLRMEDASPLVNTSSVWCSSTDHGKRMCTFKNLCFYPQDKQFLFVLGNDSIISGIESKDDLKKLDFSSVLNHNKFKMKVVLISPQHEILKKSALVLDPIFFIARFKMDNIMHVLHDDLLPLYSTYTHICKGDIQKCSQKYTIIFIDDDGESPFNELYNLFSHKNPIHFWDLTTSNLVCFSESSVGLLSSSLWFQYGFGKPQGPIRPVDLHFSFLQQFSNFVIKRLNISTIHTPENQKFCVLLSRRVNRRILNEELLVQQLKATYAFKFPGEELNVVSMDLSTNKTTSLISHILSANIVVGMHGSAMILCLFLQQGSVAIELFPFGINPDNVSPLKALNELPGSTFHYFFWVNSEENNSVPNEHGHPLLGGLDHLPEDERRYIKSIKAVPAVECCHSPIYLYRMFQDTVVGSDFITMFRDIALKYSSKLEKTDQKHVQDLYQFWYFPGPVYNVSCILTDGLLFISWSPPLNIDTNAQYSVALLSGGDLKTSLLLNNTHVTVPFLPTNQMQTVHIWIKCVSGNTESTDVYAECLKNVVV